MTFFNKLSIQQRILEKLYRVSTKILSSTTFSILIIIRNVYWAANQYIIMISEGSCDAEANDAENSALHLKKL